MMVAQFSTFAPEKKQPPRSILKRSWETSNASHSDQLVLSILASTSSTPIVRKSNPVNNRDEDVTLTLMDNKENCSTSRTNKTFGGDALSKRYGNGSAVKQNNGKRSKTRSSIQWADEQPGCKDKNWASTTMPFYKYDAPKRCSFLLAHNSITNREADKNPHNIRSATLDFLDIDETPEDSSLRAIGDYLKGLSISVKTSARDTTKSSCTTPSPSPFVAAFPRRIPQQRCKKPQTPMVNNHTTSDDSKVTLSTPTNSNSSRLMTDPHALSYAVSQDMVKVASVSFDEKRKCMQVRTHVQNIAFHKDVSIRMTTDNWKSFQDYSCSFESSKAIGQDCFLASIPLNSQCNSVQFCVRYSVDGKEYWDNNCGRNYSITRQS